MIATIAVITMDCFILVLLDSAINLKNRNSIPSTRYDANLDRKFTRMRLFQNAQFHASVHALRDLPPPSGQEVAFAGRSNAGKSSAINTLTNRTRLAFVSKTPGRTQLINFFALAEGRFLVDLPGYGYAEVPEKIRQHWRGVLGAYLQHRESLVGLILIMDARHPMTKLDRQMLDWFAGTGKPVHILLTKSDKLTRQVAMQTLAQVRRALQVDYPGATAQLFSSLRRLGIEEAEARIQTWFNLDGEDKKTLGQGEGQGGMS